jgi:hypothetical protein
MKEVKELIKQLKYEDGIDEELFQVLISKIK